MEVFITKYALTKGIETGVAEFVEGWASIIRVLEGAHNGMYFSGEGKEWHKTLERAQSRAEEMRKKKIKKVKAQLKKLQALSFREDTEVRGRGEIPADQW